MSLTGPHFEARREAICSSDAPAIVGKGPRTRQHVFNEKVFGTRSPTEDWQRYGSHAEAGIVAYRVEELGGEYLAPSAIRAMYGDLIVHEDDFGILISHPERRALCSPDALVTVDGELRIIEAKNVAWDNSAEWGEEDEDCPEHYWLQCQWQMGVLGIANCDLVAAIGGRPPATWSLDFDPRLFEDLLVVAEDFWERYVIPKEPPGPIDGSDAASEYLRRAYPKELHGVLARATIEEEDIAHAYSTASDLERENAEHKAAMRNKLCALLGDRLGVVLSDGRRATWKWQDGKNGPTRVLRVSKGR